MKPMSHVARVTVKNPSSLNDPLIHAMVNYMAAVQSPTYNAVEAR